MLMTCLTNLCFSYHCLLLHRNKNECHKPKKDIHIECSHIVKQSTTIMRNKNLKMETIRNTYISSRKESQMLL